MRSCAPENPFLPAECCSGMVFRARCWRIAPEMTTLLNLRGRSTDAVHHKRHCVASCGRKLLCLVVRRRCFSRFRQRTSSLAGLCLFQAAASLHLILGSYRSMRPRVFDLSATKCTFVDQRERDVMDLRMSAFCRLQRQQELLRDQMHELNSYGCSSVVRSAS